MLPFKLDVGVRSLARAVKLHLGLFLVSQVLRCLHWPDGGVGRFTSNVATNHLASISYSICFT